MRIKINVLNGKIVEQESFSRYLASIGDGTHYLNSINISELISEEDFRKYYFFIRDALWEERGEYTKKELHSIIKQLVLPELWDDTDNFNVMNPHLYPPSTKYLSKYGWKNFLEAVKQFSQDEYNVYF